MSVAYRPQKYGIALTRQSDGELLANSLPSL